jgi:hypothetical protein
MSDGSSTKKKTAVPQTRMHEKYREGFGKIDQHNHIRQGTASFSQALGTKDWKKRVTSEFFGVVDANVRLFTPGFHVWIRNPLILDSVDSVWIP